MIAFKFALGFLFILNTAVFTLISAAWLSRNHNDSHSRLTITALVLCLVNVIINSLLFVSLY